MTAMINQENKRVAIPKSIRFEVFKRDSFTCQYCGESAPNVILNVDHIYPVSKGGAINSKNWTRWRNAMYQVMGEAQ